MIQDALLNGAGASCIEKVKNTVAVVVGVCLKVGLEVHPEKTTRSTVSRPRQNDL